MSVEKGSRGVRRSALGRHQVATGLARMRAALFQSDAALARVTETALSRVRWPPQAAKPRCAWS